MSDDQDEAAAKIEQDRRRREEILLLLLLSLTAESEQHARYAIRLGSNPIEAARRVWLGHEGIEQAGAAPAIAEAMADAAVSGVRRAYLLAGMTPAPKAQDAAAIERLTLLYTAQAMDTANRIWTVIEQKLSAVSQRMVSATIRDQIQALGLSFDAAQVTKDHPRLLETHVERAVVSAHNVGMWQAFKGDPGHNLLGFRHVSVIDEGTTDICRERAGLQYRKDNPYWRTNWPMLHFGCRSYLAPLFGATMEESDRYPIIPPAPGFGYAPAEALGSYFGVHV